MLLQVIGPFSLFPLFQSSLLSSVRNIKTKQKNKQTKTKTYLRFCYLKNVGIRWLAKGCQRLSKNHHNGSFTFILSLFIPQQAALPTHSSQCYQSPVHSEPDTHLPLCSHSILSQRLNNGLCRDIVQWVSPSHAKWNCVLTHVALQSRLPYSDLQLCDRIFTPLSFSAQAFSSLKMEKYDSIYIWECPNVCPLPSSLLFREQWRSFRMLTPCGHNYSS